MVKTRENGMEEEGVRENGVYHVERGEENSHHQCEDDACELPAGGILGLRVDAALERMAFPGCAILAAAAVSLFRVALLIFGGCRWRGGRTGKQKIGLMERSRSRCSSSPMMMWQKCYF